MKKVILALSVVGLMTACSSSTETEAPKTDSTAVVAPASITVEVGSTGSVAVEAVKTDSVPAVKK